MKAPLLVTAGASSVFAALVLVASMPAPAQAEGEDTGAYVKRTLRCDGFQNNRCYRFADPRRRGKPYLQPHFHKHHQHHHHHRDAYETRYVVERPSLVAREVRDHSWRDRDYRDRDRDYRDRDYRERDYYDRRDRYGRYDRHERYERQCLHLVTAKGTEAQTENGALVSAKRAWRAWVRSDHGERYQDLDAAKNGEYRCWRSSTNESTIGKVGEFLTGQYRKRCQVWAVPCLGERHTLDGDKDDRE
jgi:hypothetical protein